MPSPVSAVGELLGTRSFRCRGMSPSRLVGSDRISDPSLVLFGRALLDVQRNFIPILVRNPNIFFTDLHQRPFDRSLREAFIRGRLGLNFRIGGSRDPHSDT